MTWLKAAPGEAFQHAYAGMSDTIPYYAERTVRISGDQVLPKIGTNVVVGPSHPNGGPLKLFLDSVDKFADLTANALILPSHGPVFHGLHERLAQLKQHRDELLAEVVTGCTEPKTAADLLPAFFRRELDAHQVVFAMGEAIAHLNYLMYGGRLTRTANADGVLYFGRP